MRELWARILDLLRRDSLDRELKEEFAFHEEMPVRDARAGGAGGAEAEEAARRLIGNITSARERSRDAWGFAWLDVLQQDLRYAFRGLRRSPGFTTAVIVTLGLGIGANAAMFGVIDRLMFRPFPHLREPSRVHLAYIETSGRTGAITRSVFPYTTYLDLARWSGTFSDHAAFAQRRLAIGTGEVARERMVAGVSASFFGFFDARPAAGRYFDLTEDSIPRGADVAILGYGFWKSEFGGRNVIGMQLPVGPLHMTVIGVAPEGFVGTAAGESPAVFIPITTFAYGVNQGDALTFFTRYNWDWMSMMVRRKPGISEAATSSDLSTAFTRSTLARQAFNRSIGANWGLAPLD